MEQNTIELPRATPELLDALEGLLSVVDESDGVMGWHLNGDIAQWDEFNEDIGVISDFVAAVRDS